MSNFRFLVDKVQIWEELPSGCPVATCLFYPSIIFRFRALEQTEICLSVPERK